MPGVATDQVRRTFVVLVVLHSSRYCLQKITLEFVSYVQSTVSPFFKYLYTRSSAIADKPRDAAM